MRLTMPSFGSAATTRSVIGAYCSRMPAQSRAAAITSSSVLHCAVDELDAGARRRVALELEVGKVVVGEQDVGHGGADFGGRRTGTRAQRYVRRRNWSSGLTALGRATAHRRYNRRPPDAATVPRTPRSGVPDDQRLLQTTIAGSLPKPAWLAKPSELWAPWKLEGDALAEGKRDAVRLVLRDQEHAGIDIVTDGEQTRRHFVTTFIEALDGVDFEHKQTVRIRNRYDADVPVVVGPGRAAASDLRRRRRASCARRRPPR